MGARSRASRKWERLKGVSAVMTRASIWDVLKWTKRLVREMARISEGVSLLHMMGCPEGYVEAAW